MAEHLSSWISTHVNICKKMDINRLSNEFFFREEVRPIIRNIRSFYSPADGVVMYVKKVKVTDPIVEIKGVTNYTVKQILGNSISIDFNEALVVGIFMTFYDIHVNRIPTDGFLSYHREKNIQSRNMPMILVEKALFENKFIEAQNRMSYLQNNERMVNEVHYRTFDYIYYMVQIADDDVSVIAPFSLDQYESYKQGDRYSFVRWGSQVELILPIVDYLEFEPVIQPEYHVKGGIDELVRIKNK